VFVELNVLERQIELKWLGKQSSKIDINLEYKGEIRACHCHSRMGSQTCDNLFIMV
jgi:hypothetical protein